MASLPLPLITRSFDGNIEAPADSSIAPSNVIGIVFIKANATTSDIKNGAIAGYGIICLAPSQIRTAIPATLYIWREGITQSNPPIKVPRTT
jgi:hypothetical protein